MNTKPLSSGSATRCHLTAEFPRGSFWAAWDELKARGWRAHPDNDGQAEGVSWSHSCGKCAREAVRGILDRPSNKLRSA